LHTGFLPSGFFHFGDDSSGYFLQIMDIAPYPPPLLPMGEAAKWRQGTFGVTGPYKNLASDISF
jgi:hypothetical protein